MNPFKQLIRSSIATILIAGSLQMLQAAEAPSQVDDFSNANANSLGLPRMHVDDTSAGGKTAPTYKIADGVFSAKGEIVPPRGQPGWASTVLLLDPQGQAVDASQYEGILLRVRVNKGNLSISANSTEITNFDYHAAPIVRQSGSDFHEVKIPFASMKRAWSEQTRLNTKTIASLSLTAFSLQKASFDFEIDEVRFY
ncbi:MAG: CIA30 family protein [Verrucomicrobiota bacterium]